MVLALVCRRASPNVLFQTHFLESTELPILAG
jgi:hypothetical protein